MANKKLEKVKLNTMNLISALHSRKISMLGLGRDETFDWTDKTIRRAISDKEASPQLMHDLAKRLDVDIKYLTGEQEIEKLALIERINTKVYIISFINTKDIICVVDSKEKALQWTKNVDCMCTELELR